MINNSASDSEVVTYLAEVQRTAANDAAVAAELARAFAASGETFKTNARLTSDIASTGGPTSLSTLLGPLFLNAAGCTVVKLGVPGRPAGGIDCMAQLPSYKIELSQSELTSILSNSAFAHFLGADRFAPMDARVFKLRQEHGLQDVPTLVAASLLSKKLAVGVRYAGLDVRVGSHGNFGRDMRAATANAVMFIRAAVLLGIDGRPVITNGELPYQPYIGRKESLAALWLLFESRACPWLISHMELCRTLALACVPPDIRVQVARLEVNALREAFLAHVQAQGSSQEEFDSMARSVLESHKESLIAREHGFVYCDLLALRQAMVQAQKANSLGRKFPDPVGLILLRRPGEWVEKGSPIATMRIEEGAAADAVESCKNTVCVTQLPTAIGVEGVGLHG